MVYGLSWSQLAIRDLLDIHNYTARHLYASSRPLVTRLFAGVQRLKTFPRSGRTVPEWGDPDWREIVVPPFRVQYQVVGRDVVIQRVFHSRRSLPSRPDEFR
ncbi:type II toxin-antitoxin system RelE/ParE family toxin [Longimicrobium sp.]|uniref:type II toxin-antitoxin system RelE/ParE family toxin n=1 Tax=Longimicrobium sp. TaxID=2029185 RepID=UPI0039C99DD8